MIGNSTVSGKQPLLAFLLGIIAGGCMAVCLFAAVIMYALNYKIESIPANTDGEGDYIYVNAEDGGAKNTAQLVTKIMDLSQNVEELSLGDIEQVFPATANLVQALQSALGQYLDISEEEIRNISLDGMDAFIGKKIADLHLNCLISFGQDGIIDKVLDGQEAAYMCGAPIYYDRFEWADGVYIRADGATINPTLNQYVRYEDGCKKLYFYNSDDGWKLARKTSDGYEATDTDYIIYNADCATLTGNYYMEGDTKHSGEPVTVGMLFDGGIIAGVIKDSVNNTPIRKLYSDGTISLESAAALENTVFGTQKKLGDMTVKELLETATAAAN